MDFFESLADKLRRMLNAVEPGAEVRRYMDYWIPEQMHVLDGRPGIAGLASILVMSQNGRNGF